MTGKQWLTIDDWLECGLPICSLEIKHEGRLERAAADSAQTIFSSQRIGGTVLRNGNSQECIQLSTFPELLVILLHVESLEDNEAITIQGARQISRIIDPKNKSFFEKLEKPRVIPICCMDAENYFEFPINQFEEDNVLRELNKCLLTFRQNSTCAILESLDRSNNLPKLELRSNSRLSPIGESESTNSPDDVSMKIIIKQASTSTKKSSYDSGRIEGKDFVLTILRFTKKKKNYFRYGSKKIMAFTITNSKWISFRSNCIRKTRKIYCIGIIWRTFTSQ